MTHENLVFEALAYRRNVGATLGEIRTYLGGREGTKHTQKEDRAVLRRLEEQGLVLKLGDRWFFTTSGYKLTRGPALGATWQEADSWILLAALYIGEPGDWRLPHLIATADYINHAIPTLEEMHGAINRLLAGGLIKAKRDTFSVTAEALSLFAKVQATTRRYVLDQWDGLRRILDCPCCGVKLGPIRWRFLLDSATHRAAVESYSEMTRRN